MGDLQTRPFSRDYSGLVNQTVIGLSITLLCVTGQELMKRKRRGQPKDDSTELGSRESWEFGYLYNGRSWARHPTAPVTNGWPLSWIWGVIKLPEAEMNKLRGIDATLYVRFLRGAFWFTLLHTLTTFPILFPIHVKFSDDEISPKSMTRASISSLVNTDTGRSLLWVHICILFWVTISWILTLCWICHGAFRMRQDSLQAIIARVEASEKDTNYYPHPHPQHSFTETPLPKHIDLKDGLRLRTVMVSNVPSSLRDEKELKEYFEYYMSRKLEKPSMGLTSSTQPGFLNKTFAFIFNRAKRIPDHLPPILPVHFNDDPTYPPTAKGHEDTQSTPVIERVVIARKMTELASLLERREEILCLLETAHIKLANKALTAVKVHMERQRENGSGVRKSSAGDETGDLEEEERMRTLISALGPFVEDFKVKLPSSVGLRRIITGPLTQAFTKGCIHLGGRGRGRSLHEGQKAKSYYVPPISSLSPTDTTIWDALLSLPRHYLDPYQPLVNLNHLFRGQTVPSIDYYTTKLNLLSSLITENRAKSATDFDPVSTAFVTFADPNDARRACKYLAVHPDNPLLCLVTMAPMYHDLDWLRVMKSSFRVEFVKDWVVNVGVWAFTLFWLFPVSFLVGLVSIRNISLFWPSLKRYLDKHEWESEVIQSFIPTVLVALLALLIPLILLLIAKKAHTITTLSALHDRIMTRYYKFLIVNVLVFFCVGVAVLQSFLLSIRSTATTRPDIIQVVADSFPTAGPFYVGWLIFTTAMHNGFEIALIGLPLIVYPSTKRQVTPRKRTVGIRPRTFNYYYWLPNHMLVVHILLLFSILNPVVLPFGTLYFFVSTGVIKNQLLRVYAKNYEGDGQLLLIRIVRYSLDGLILSQAVFLAYMVVLKKTTNVGLAACLIIITTFVKIFITRLCRARFEHDDVLEADIICGYRPPNVTASSDPDNCTSQVEGNRHDNIKALRSIRPNASKFTWRLPEWVNFSYATVQHRTRVPRRRQPNPFGPHTQSFSRLRSVSRDGAPLPQNAGDGEVVAQPKMPSRSDKRLIAELEPDKIIPSNLPDEIMLGGPVVPHPPPRPWDDQNTFDLPYDNPFYTRSISNVLWLPRNPCGILDLDDTVDLRTSLTVDPSAGQLGNWVAFTDSPVQMDMPLPPCDDYPSTPEALPSIRRVNGTEEIELPKAIAKRVHAKEESIESTVRSHGLSVYRRRLSADKSVTGTILTRRRSELDSARPVSHRSLSDTTSFRGRARARSIMSTLRPPTSRKERSRSTDYEFGLRPDTHAPADLMTINASTSQTSIVQPRTARGQNVTTHQAIVHEVLAEEEHVHASRLEEEAEATKSKSTKSWMTSWMFRKWE
ncbi:hypothetical protein AX16_008052 [Volvariella volvacea WC 439]|nr:hypothetical protein AX16_008052 [Volvariella volvacea WC 439]